jgi:hypothetical protein
MSFLLLLALLQADDPQKALDAFKTAYKSKEVAERAAAVAELAKTEHEKVLAKLAQLLVVDDKTVRIAAAKGMGDLRQTDLRKKAVGYLSKAVPPNAAEVDVIVALIETLELIGPGVGLAVLHQHFLWPQIPVGEGAVIAAGKLKRKESVQPLITLLKLVQIASREAQNVGPGGKTVTGGGLPGVSGGAVDPDAPKREKILTPLATRSLEQITKMSFKTWKEWETWWKEKGPDFEVPK